MNKNKILKAITLVATFIVGLGACSVEASEDLARNTLLGIMPEQTGANQPVVLQTVVANSTASTLGLQAGDKILSINDSKINDFAQLLNVVRPLKSQQPIKVTVERKNRQLVKSGKMQPRPYEVSDIATVLYESVTYKGNKLRSITYRPKPLAKQEVSLTKQETPLANQEKAPAIFFIQGYTCSSIDYGMMPNVTTKQLVEQLVAQGYVVFRVEKPGVGDSQSEKQCSEIDFTTESIAFTEALKALKTKPYVDADQIYLWGHSLGVLHSAVVAKNEPVAGIVGYGGVLKGWYQYMLDIYQHQSVKHFGASKQRATQNTQTIQPFLDSWLNTNTPWQQIVESDLAQKAINADLVAINGEQVIDRHYSFFRDLNQYDLASYWQKMDVPLLMMHGSLDIQAIEKNWAFDLVNLSSNPLSKALEIEGAEHAFMRYQSKADYREARNNRRFNPAEPGNQFDQRIGKETLDWLQKVRDAQAKALQKSQTQAQFSGVNHLTYTRGITDKAFVGNGFLIDYQGKTYAVTVKHSLLEAKTSTMKYVSIKGHINEWRIYPNHHPDQYVKLGRLLNESLDEALDMQVLTKDWLIFEVAENRSNLQVLKLRTTPLTKGEEVTAYGCSYAVKNSCTQDIHKGQFVKNSGANLRVAMANLDMGKLRGLSGSPVLDKKNQLVGIVSNVMRSETGDGFDFAPANLDYLLSELNKIAS